jgi:hypothetical protein
MKHRRIILGLAAALAAALLVPSAASARPLKVSRDVGVYAGANTSKALGVVKAGETVDVQCWTTGQSIGGYAIWDLVKVRNISGYVHDKYVEIPGGKSPEEASIRICGSAGQPAPSQPNPGPARCQAATWTRYLSVPESITKDSYFRVTWSPRFCPRGGSGDYSVEFADPDVHRFGPATFSGLELDLDKAIVRSDGRRATVSGRVRQCLGGKFSGVCFTAARVKLAVGLGKRVSFFAPHVNTNKAGRRLFGASMTWTTKQL